MRVAPTAVGNSDVTSISFDRAGALGTFGELFADLRSRGKGAPGQDNAVGNLAAQGHHLRKNRGDIDRDHRAKRGKPKVETLDAYRFACVVDAAVAQQRADDRHGLAASCQRLAIGHAVLRLDLNPVARSYPQHKTTAGYRVDRCCGHRDRRHRADEDTGDSGPELDFRGLCRAGRQYRELVAAMPFGDPSRLVAERLGELDAVDDLGRVGSAGERDTEPLQFLLLSIADMLQPA